MTSLHSTKTDMILVEARIRQDRAEIARALTDLKSGVSDRATHMGKVSLALLVLFLSVRFAHRWL